MDKADSNRLGLATEPDLIWELWPLPLLLLIIAVVKFLPAQQIHIHKAWCSSKTVIETQINLVDNIVDSLLCIWLLIYTIRFLAV